MSSSFSKECQELFGVTNLYAVLGLEIENTDKLTEKEIKRAYYKCSLKYHPDRVQNGDGSSADEAKLATKQFQLLGKVYSILGDQEKRKIYDETGTIDEEDGFDDDFDWQAYWRKLFKKVTAKDIDDFKRKYKGSQEEIDDLKIQYMQHEGDLKEIYDAAYCVDKEEDRERVRSILEQLITQGDLEHFEKFDRQESAKEKRTRLRKAAKEAAEAEEMLKEMTGKSEMNNDELVSAITKRNASRGESLLASLEAKYGGTKTRGGKKRTTNDDDQSTKKVSKSKRKN